MFGNDRTALRRAYRDAWLKQQRGEPLQPLESQIANVIAMHPEYHSMLEDEQILDRDYSPEQGQSNPFLHMGMHIAIHEQLSTDRPAGIASLYQSALLKQGGDAHAVEHTMMECLGTALWEAQRSGRTPDEQAYLECLRNNL